MRKCFVFLAVALSGAMLARPARAEVLKIVPAAWVVHDSNLFKRADAVPETIDVGSIGLRFDKPYSLQRFQCDVAWSRHHYRNTTYLDFDAFDYRAAWLWYLTPRIGGSLRADRIEDQVPFQDFRGIARNVRVTTTESANLDADLLYNVHLLLGASVNKQTSEEPFPAQPDFKIARTDAGLSYTPQAGNSISLIQRLGRGEYINLTNEQGLPDTKFKEYETELLVNWLVTGRSTALFRLTHVSRKHDNLHQLDSAGPGGEVTYSWNATGKVAVVATARRDFIPYFASTTTHRIDKTLGLAPKWQATGTLAFGLDVRKVDSEFFGGVPPPGTEARKDHASGIEISGTWLPTRIWTLSASAQRQHRTSNDPSFSFDATITRISASLAF